MFVAVRCLTLWASQKIHDCRISHLIPLRLCHLMSSDSYFPIFTQEASAMCNGGSLVDLISHHWCFCWCGYVEECQVANKLCTHSPLLHCAPSPAYNSGKWQKLVDNSPFLLRKEILGGGEIICSHVQGILRNHGLVMSLIKRGTALVHVSSYSFLKTPAGLYKCFCWSKLWGNELIFFP